MKSYEALEQMTSDLDIAESFEIIWDIFFSEQLCCYSNASYSDLDQLAHNFFTYHARVPSWVGGDTVATQPAIVAVADFTPEQYKDLSLYGFCFRAAIYHNGAAVIVCKNNVLDKYLFVTKETFSKWAYPKEGMFSMSELFPKV